MRVSTRFLAITFVAGSALMTKTKDLNLTEVKEYIWSKYIDLEEAESVYDEKEFLPLFEKHYETTNIESDNENFYYGIVLFEQGWNNPDDQEKFFYKAYRIFNIYKKLSGENDWESVEDRMEDIKGWFDERGIDPETLEEKYGEVKGEPVETERLRDLCPPGMTLVSSGEYKVGPGGATVQIDSFYIDILPVTNENFAKFIEATNYRTPKYWADAQFNQPTQPVVGVSFFDAMKYAQWAGKDLPSAEQWTAAAAGTDSLAYPWGAEFRGEIASWKGSNDKQELRPAGLHPDNRSWAGCLDMAGNVWEWTTSWKEPEKVFRIVKGGSFADPPELLRNDSILWASGKEKVDILGFRCIKPCKGVR